MDKLSAAMNIVRQWCVEITDKDKVLIDNLLMGEEKTELSPLLSKYINLLEPYIHLIKTDTGKIREHDCLASGIVFFYGCLFYIMHFPSWKNYIDDIFAYDLLYILVDHYIDDINIDEYTKNGVIASMYILLENPMAEVANGNKLLQTIAKIYNQMIRNRPNVKSSVYDIFKSEIDGLTIQNNSQCTREEYYKIALEKGGHTMKLLAFIVDKPELKDASYHLGTIMQLIDDSVDVLSDIDNGINTIATHDYKTKGNIDDLWYDIIFRISSIDDRFTLFKIIYTWFAVYIPDRLPMVYSTELRLNSHKYNIFTGYDGCQLLLESINLELKTM